MACNEIQVFINTFVMICVCVGMSDTRGFQWWEGTVGCPVINKLCINLCTLYSVHVWCTNVCLWWLIQCMCKVYHLERYLIWKIFIFLTWSLNYPVVFLLVHSIMVSIHGVNISFCIYKVLKYSWFLLYKKTTVLCNGTLYPFWDIASNIIPDVFIY